MFLKSNEGKVQNNYKILRRDYDRGKMKIFIERKLKEFVESKKRRKERGRDKGVG